METVLEIIKCSTQYVDTSIKHLVAKEDSVKLTNTIHQLATTLLRECSFSPESQYLVYNKIHLNNSITKYLRSNKNLTHISLIMMDTLNKKGTRLIVKLSEHLIEGMDFINISISGDIIETTLSYISFEGEKYNSEFYQIGECNKLVLSNETQLN